MGDKRWGRCLRGPEWEKVDFIGSVKDWNEDTKNNHSGISGEGRACPNMRIGWKIVGYLQLRKEQKITVSFQGKCWGMWPFKDTGARGCTWKLLKTNRVHRAHLVGCLCRVGEWIPASTSYFQKLLSVFPTILPYSESWNMSLSSILSSFHWVYIFLIVWEYLFT